MTDRSGYRDGTSELLGSAERNGKLLAEARAMLSAMLFSIAMVALCQFALYYWRAVLTGVASQRISSRILEAANVEEQLLSGDHFRKLADLYALTPELRGKGGSLGFVGVYYHLLERLGQASARFAPSALRWSEREQLLCARYAAVQIGRRLEANLAQAASLRSC